MPHLASGAGRVTSLTLLNTGATPADSRLDVHGEDGNALALSLASPRAWLAGTVVGTTTGSEQAMKTGYARITTRGYVSGFAIFQNAGQEAALPLRRPAAGTSVLVFDNTSGLATRRGPGQRRREPHYHYGHLARRLGLGRGFGSHRPARLGPQISNADSPFCGRSERQWFGGIRRPAWRFD